MAYEYITSERLDGVALITLNRPEKLNALSFPLMEELDHALTGYEADDDIKAVILTGAGERAFSAGADIHEMAGLIPRTGSPQRHPRPHQLAHRELYETADRRDQRSRLWRRGVVVVIARPADRLRADAVPVSRRQLRPRELELVAAGPVGIPKAKELLYTGRVGRSRRPSVSVSSTRSCRRRS